MDMSPDIYGEAFSSQNPHGLHLLKQIPNSTISRAGIIVLDIGCGPGSLTSHILERMSPDSLLVALDVDPLMIQSCFSQTSRKFPHHQIKCLLQGFSVPFRRLKPEVAQLEGKVDVIICNFVLHWILPKDRSEAVNSIERLLRPGAQAYISIILLPNLLGAGDSFEERQRFQHVLDFPSCRVQEKMWRCQFGDGNFSQFQMSCLSGVWKFKPSREFLLFKKVRRVFMVHAKEGSYPPEGPELNNFLELIEELLVRYNVHCHEKVVGRLGDPEEAKTMYYEYMRVIAKK